MPTTSPHANQDRVLTAQCILGLGPQSPERSAWLERQAHREASAGGTLYTWNAEVPFGEAFGAVSGLFAPLVREAMHGAPGFVQQYAPELLQIWPQLRDDPSLAAAPCLDGIALGGTKRRLHKDSEQLFRIVHGLASFVDAALPRIAIATPLVLSCDNLDAADRLSIVVLVHVLHRLPDRLVLVAALEREWLDDPSSPGRPWVWGAEAIMEGAPDPALEAMREHAVVLRNIFALEGTTCEIVHGQIKCGEPLPTDPATAFAALGADRQTIARLLPEQAGTGSIEFSTISRRQRRRILESLPADKRRQLHAVILAAQPRRLGPAEADFASRSYHALLAGRLSEGLAAALRALDAGFGFSMNFELMLACGGEARRHAEGEAAIALGLMLALVTQYIGHEERSAEELERLHGNSPPGVLRAQISFYLGLTLAKKLGRLGEGLGWLEAGLREVEGNQVTDWRAALEYGWLCNALAFCHWRSGRTDEAHAVVGNALRAVKDYSEPQVINLKINLINNLSVLRESVRDFAGALRTWHSLAELNTLVEGGRFSKSYQYRCGWLLLQAGDPAGALACYEESYHIAEAVRDVFHMDIISRACGYVSIICGEFAAAERWYETNRKLLETLGDRVNAARAWATVALVAEIQGQLDKARHLAEEGLALARLHRRIAVAGAVAQQIAEIGVRTPEAALEAGLSGRLAAGFEKPKMKLTTPFAIAHLVADGRSTLFHLTLSPMEVGV